MSAMQLQSFVFNDFQENTYVLYDSTGECVIIDPGAYRPNEKLELLSFIENEKLKPKFLLNTHCHIDHILSNKLVKQSFSIPFLMHEKDLPVLERALDVGKNYGIFMEQSPPPDKFLEEGEKINFGKTELEIIFTPGHSPGSISFFNRKEKILLSGDVLFKNSIGRFDFPGGNYETLMDSIVNKLLLLDDDVKVFSGHGPMTTIGYEKKNNPFVLEFLEAQN